MSFDSMAAAIDWLDAFRSGDLESILKMFADDAVVECGCCLAASVANKDDLRAFWQRRLHDCAPLELDDLEPSGEGILLTYVMRGGLVAATLDFDPIGRIVSLRCDLVSPSPADLARNGIKLASP